MIKLKEENHWSETVSMRCLYDHALKGLQRNEDFKELLHEFSKLNLKNYDSVDSFLSTLEKHFKSNIVLYTMQEVFEKERKIIE